MKRPAPFVSTFAPQAAAIGNARRFVCRALDRLGVDEWPADLVATELATNAVCHAGTPFTIRVSLDEAVGAVEIEVADGDPQLPVVEEYMPSADVDSGRGLRIVEALTRTWGAYTDGCGKTVWCEVPAGRNGP